MSLDRRHPEPGFSRVKDLACSGNLWQVAHPFQAKLSLTRKTTKSRTDD